MEVRSRRRWKLVTGSRVRTIRFMHRRVNVWQRNLSFRVSFCARCRDWRIDPVALTLEGIGGQRHPMSFLPSIESWPIDFRTGQPKLSQSLQQKLRVVLLFTGMS